MDQIRESEANDSDSDDDTLAPVDNSSVQFELEQKHDRPQHVRFVPEIEQRKLARLGKHKKVFQSTLYTNEKRRNSIPLTNALELYKPAERVGALLEGKQSLLRVLIIEDGKPEGKIEDISLMALLRNIRDRNEKISSHHGAASSMDRDCIPLLRGRDLCRLTKYGKEMDVPVFLIRQYCIIISIRYDMRAIIQSDRIIFISHQDDFGDLEELKRCVTGAWGTWSDQCTLDLIRLFCCCLCCVGQSFCSHLMAVRVAPWVGPWVGPWERGPGPTKSVKTSWGSGLLP
jgi:hypothetical protein